MAKMSFNKLEEVLPLDISKILIEYSNDTKTKVGNFFLFANRQSPLWVDVVIANLSKEKRNKQIIVAFVFSRKIELIEKYLDPYLDLLIPFNKLNSEKDGQISYTFTLPIDIIRQHSITVSSENYNFEVFQEKAILSIQAFEVELNRISDIYVLNEMANQQIDFQTTLVYPRNRGASGIYYHKMIIAKLAGNPMYEEIYKYFTAILEESIAKQSRYMEKNKVHLHIVKKLYEDLKDVQPLENPILV